MRDILRYHILHCVSNVAVMGNKCLYVPVQYKNNTIITIFGPTASGKSALALGAARVCNGVIINADSMQLYAEAPILTAQPTEEERALVPHYLYGIRKADDPCNAAQWGALAVVQIRECWQAGQVPVLVGGTGLYLHALQYGLHAVPEIDATVRNEVRAMAADELVSALQHEDATMAARLNEGDMQRIARALEVVRSTGKSLLHWQGQPRMLPLPEAHWCNVNLMLPRDVLYARINTRYDAMIAAGGLAEAEALYTRQYGRTLPLMRAVGIAQLLTYYDDNMTLEDAIIHAKTASRRYAKRQSTWARKHCAGALQLKAGDVDNVATIIAELT